MSVQSRSFSTAGMPTTRMLEAWRDYMAEVYYRVDVKPREEEQLRGELHELLLGQLGLSNFIADQQRVLRYAGSCPRDNADNYVFIFPRRQRLYFDQRGRSGLIDPGHGILLRSSEYYEAACPDGFENVTIKVPASLLSGRVRGIDDLCARPAACDPVIASLLSGMAFTLIHSDAGWSERRTRRLSEIILDLLALMLESAEPGQAAERNHKPMMDLQFERICRHVKQNLSNPELSPASVSRALGISVRYLHKLFSRRNTTFGRWLLDARLQDARGLIQSDLGRALTLQAISFSCGFVSQAHFSTQYRARFGETPRATRDNC